MRERRERERGEKLENVRHVFFGCTGNRKDKRGAQFQMVFGGDGGSTVGMCIHCKNVWTVKKEHMERVNTPFQQVIPRRMTWCTEEERQRRSSSKS